MPKLILTSKHEIEFKDIQSLEFDLSFINCCRVISPTQIRRIYTQKVVNSETTCLYVQFMTGKTVIIGTVLQ